MSLSIFVISPPDTNFEDRKKGIVRKKRNSFFFLFLPLKSQGQEFSIYLDPLGWFR